MKVIAFLEKIIFKQKLSYTALPIEQVPDIRYLGCSITYQYDKKVETKLVFSSRFIKYLKKKTRIEMQLGYCNVLVIPQLQYDGESWIIKTKDVPKLQGPEMTFLRAVYGPFWYQERFYQKWSYQKGNINKWSLNNTISWYKTELQLYVERMDSTRFPNNLQPSTREKRSVASPHKLWLDEFHWNRNRILAREKDDGNNDYCIWTHWICQ